MRSLQVTALYLLLGFLFPSCINNGLSEQGAKTLDSLGGALLTVVEETKNRDTVQLENALDRYFVYKVFIRDNIHDTLSLSEAQLCRNFFNSGKALEISRNNRLQLLARAALVSSQLIKLSRDLHEGTLDEDAIKRYIEIEKSETVMLISKLQQEHKAFCSGMEEFKLSLLPMQNFIKEHNEGLLPTKEITGEEF
jgi:hypothetical protein